MNDLITLRGIKGFGYHGVFEFERRDGQDFFVDVEMTLNLDDASTTDRLEETVDYGAVANLVLAEIEGEPVDLIERLAGRIAEKIKENYPRVEKVAVTVHKPQAPVDPSFTDISVTIHR